MKYRIEIDSELSNDEIVIKCSKETREIIELCEQFKNMHIYINVNDNNELFKVLLSDVLYFDCVDNKTFVYLNDKVYSCEDKLYEIEEKFSKEMFFRINKSCILNMEALKSVRRTINGKLIVKLINDEELVINRSYVNSFKERFGL